MEENIIKYKTQVLALLYVAITKYNKEYITSGDLLNYRIALAEYYAENGFRVKLEVSKEIIEEFNQTFRYEINAELTENGYIYSLTNEGTTLLLTEMLAKSAETGGELEILMNEEIIKEVFGRGNTLKK